MAISRRAFLQSAAALTASACGTFRSARPAVSKARPNIIFIMADDHAAHAIGCYGSRINTTPNIDRIAQDGMRFDNCFCTNSICTPSRAAILTGTYSHINGATTLATMLDGRQTTFPKLMQEQGYQTAIIGKWHLGHGGIHDPAGFDYWNVLPGQGEYHDSPFIEMGNGKIYPGYVTDVITDLSLDWLSRRDSSRPFLLLCHHKAPHRSWVPDTRHADMYDDIEIPEPETFDDDYSNRAQAAAQAAMRVDPDLGWYDMKQHPPETVPAKNRDAYLKSLGPIPLNTETSPEDPALLKKWKYQRYIKDYLRCVAAVDDNVGRMLDYLDEQGLTENTIVIYTSDQGFFLGDHGWFDKRFMYEESLRMPFLIRYPKEIASGAVNKNMILNVDFAPTFLDYAGIGIPSVMQGTSFRPLLNGKRPKDWRTSMYYRYWMHLGGHNVYAHYGVRTLRYKLIHYYAEACGQPGATDDPRPPEWELFDLDVDPHEMNNVYGHPKYAAVVDELKSELRRLQNQVGDAP